ncbi:hypothetical protein GGR53DRAFT_480169 [Hypoxylon sp. FL1150]|nr:hypothetical protein GGR53DRAFT_480169 [Hypoxylon sp. FL1150]
MLSTKTSWWLVVLVAIILDSCGAQFNESCRYCSIISAGGWRPEQWLWLHEDRPEFGLVFPTVTFEVTIIVNITSNTTSTVTETSATFTPTPYPSNDEGTRIGTISYSSGGKMVTSTLAYPTGAGIFAGTYVWNGTMEDPQSSACVTAPPLDGSTVALTTTIRETDFNWNASDPRGTQYGLVTATGDINWFFVAFSSNLTDHPAATQCPFNDGGPNWGGFTQTNWYTASQTVE